MDAPSAAAPAVAGGRGCARARRRIFVGRSVAPAPAAPATADVGVLRDEVRDLRKMVALSMLQQQSASERLMGVSWTGQLDHPDSQIVYCLCSTR